MAYTAKRPKNWNSLTKRQKRAWRKKHWRAPKTRRPAKRRTKARRPAKRRTAKRRTTSRRSGIRSVNRAMGLYGINPRSRSKKSRGYFTPGSPSKNLRHIEALIQAAMKRGDFKSAKSMLAPLEANRRLVELYKSGSAADRAEQRAIARIMSEAEFGVNPRRRGRKATRRNPRVPYFKPRVGGAWFDDPHLIWVPGYRRPIVITAVHGHWMVFYPKAKSADVILHVSEHYSTIREALNEAKRLAKRMGNADPKAVPAYPDEWQPGSTPLDEIRR